MAPDRDAVVATGRRVAALEAEETGRLAARIGEPFADAVLLLAGARGRVIVSGVGKSGIIARKIAATLTSTGTPAAWLHPVEGLHGDLGIVGREDVAILLSKSGASEELTALLGALRRMEVPVVAITGDLDSLLARHATVALDASVREEACPHDLAPTTSTTVALALGDALAVALLELKGFRREDFAALHPGGSLGRRLLLRVADVMLPPAGLLPVGATMRQAVVTLAHQRGLATVVRDGRLAGVLTAGDLSRLAERGAEFLDLPVEGVMTREPLTARPDELGAAALGRMERRGIMAMPVLDGEGRVVGAVHLHDLMRAGAV